MALAILHHEGFDGHNHQFRFEIGENRFYRVGIGWERQQLASGLEILRSPPYTLPLRQARSGYGVLRISQGYLDRPNAAIQLISFRTDDYQGPAISAILTIESERLERFQAGELRDTARWGRFAPALSVDGAEAMEADLDDRWADPFAANDPEEEHDKFEHDDAESLTFTPSPANPFAFDLNQEVVMMTHEPVDSIAFAYEEEDLSASMKFKLGNLVKSAVDAGKKLLKSGSAAEAISGAVQGATALLSGNPTGAVQMVLPLLKKSEIGTLLGQVLAAVDPALLSTLGLSPAHLTLFNTVRTALVPAPTNLQSPTQPSAKTASAKTAPAKTKLAAAKSVGVPGGNDLPPGKLGRLVAQFSPRFLQPHPWGVSALEPWLVLRLDLLVFTRLPHPSRQ
jgi:hypothetical protein